MTFSGILLRYPSAYRVEGNCPRREKRKHLDLRLEEEFKYNSLMLPNKREKNKMLKYNSKKIHLLGIFTIGLSYFQSSIAYS